MKIILLLISLFTLTACGGGGGGGGTTPTTPSDTAAPIITMSGSGTTGIIQNATVNVYTLVNGIKGTLLATGQTNNTGEFILSLSSQPSMLLVEISGDSDAVVRCDSSTGCSYKGKLYSFNTNYAIDSDFILQGITYYDGTSIDPIHLTPLSDIVSKVAIAYIVENPNDAPEDILDISNNQVAQTFNLPSTSLLTSIQPVDITGQNTNSSNLTQQQLKFSLIVSAFEDRNSEISIVTGAIATKLKNNQDVTTDKDTLLVKSVNTAKRFKQRNPNLSGMVNTTSSDIRSTVSISPTLLVSPPNLSMFDMPQLESSN